MNIHVFMVMVVMTCDFVQEMFRLFSPCPLAYGTADQARRNKVQDAAGGESRELRYSDGDVFSSYSSFFLLVDELIADELMSRI